MPLRDNTRQWREQTAFSIQVQPEHSAQQSIQLHQAHTKANIDYTRQINAAVDRYYTTKQSRQWRFIRGSGLYNTRWILLFDGHISSQQPQKAEKVWLCCAETGWKAAWCILLGCCLWARFLKLNNNMVYFEHLSLLRRKKFDMSMDCCSRNAGEKVKETKRFFKGPWTMILNFVYLSCWRMMFNYIGNNVCLCGSQLSQQASSFPKFVLVITSEIYIVLVPMQHKKMYISKATWYNTSSLWEVPRGKLN